MQRPPLLKSICGHLGEAQLGLLLMSTLPLHLQISKGSTEGHFPPARGFPVCIVCCISGDRGEHRLFGGGRRESSVFCSLCSVRSCEGACDCVWDLTLSFWHPDPLILEDLISALELKVICSLSPTERPV